MQSASPVFLGLWPVCSLVYIKESVKFQSWFSGLHSQCSSATYLYWCLTQKLRLKQDCQHFFLTYLWSVLLVICKIMCYLSCLPVVSLVKSLELDLLSYSHIVLFLTCLSKRERYCCNHRGLCTPKVLADKPWTCIPNLVFIFV